jgi:catechol 2,3-dioxygenase-like lactoylglutathione lyase family enzyme
LDTTQRSLQEFVPGYQSPTPGAGRIGPAFRQEGAADGLVSLTRKDTGMNVVFPRRGLASLPDDQRDDHADSVILSFAVDNLEAELARLTAEGVTITMPLREEPWGQRAFQATDPNGIIVELVDWNGSTSK